MPEPQSIDIITLSQAIISAHKESDMRLEQLLRELLRELPKQADLERRVTMLEGIEERIMRKIEERSNMSRAQLTTIAIAIVNGFIAIGLALFHH